MHPPRVQGSPGPHYILRSQLADFPLLGMEIPPECFESLPPNADLLRQIIVKPYRIVYETVEDEVRILSIRHSRMLVTQDDTAWT